MIKTVRGLGVASATLALTMGLAACGSDNEGADPAASGDATAVELAGEVKVDGSSTVGPLSKAAADIYAEDQPKVNVTVGISGTGGGFKKFCNGETDISDASRPIKDEEKAECEKNGVKYVELVVANDALSVVVSKENTWTECLTVAQLKSITEPDSKVNKWNQVDPSFPDEALKLFGPGTDSGTFDYWTGAINGEEKAHRTDYTPSEDDNVLVQGVSGSKGGIGYFGFTYYEENVDKLKLVKVDGGGGCVEPSVAAAQDGSYKPLSRPLFIYVSDKGVAKPQVKAFVDFYIAHIDEVVTEAKYIALTAQQKTTLKAEYDSLPKA